MATTLKLVSKGATDAGLEVSDKTFGREFNELSPVSSHENA